MINELFHFLSLYNIMADIFEININFIIIEGLILNSIFYRYCIVKNTTKNLRIYESQKFEKSNVKPLFQPSLNTQKNTANYEFKL